VRFRLLTWYNPLLDIYGYSTQTQVKKIPAQGGYN